MDKEIVVEFLRNNPKSAFSYWEITQALEKQKKQYVGVSSVKSAIRELMKETPRRIARAIAKQPFVTVSERVIQQSVAYFGIKRSAHERIGPVQKSEVP
jgi:hypothetical protein